jgi:hypothetical protein
MSKQDIYGADPQPDVQKVTDMAMKCMKGVGKVTEAESATGEAASSSRDITGNLGQAKP